MVVDFLHKYFSKSVRTSYMMALKHDGNVLDMFGARILQDKNICGDRLSEVAQNGNKVSNFYFIFSIILALPSKICKTHNK